MSLETILFATDPILIRRAGKAGIGGFIVDWERKGKATRQQGVDTQINDDTLEDLQRVRQATDLTVLCRINGFGYRTGDEVEAAVAAGADEILLPMVKQVSEVSTVLEWIGDRCRLGILVETEEAVIQASRLAELPLSRVFLGLNDLAISRNSSSLFEPLSDGTLQQVRRKFHQPFGFGGLTLPEFGDPIPSRLLLGEMARLDCGFTFLRRSFYRDMQGRQLEEEVPRIQTAIEEAFARTPEEVERDHRRLLRVLEKASPTWRVSREDSLNV